MGIPNENTLSGPKEKYIWFSRRDSLIDKLDSYPEFVKLTDNPTGLKLLYDTILESLLDPKVKNYSDGIITLKGLPKIVPTKIRPFISSFSITCLTPTSFFPLKIMGFGFYYR